MTDEPFKDRRANGEMLCVRCGCFSSVRTCWNCGTQVVPCPSCASLKGRLTVEALSEIISENSGPISAAVAVIAYLNKKTTPYEKLQMEIIRLREENAALRSRLVLADKVAVPARKLEESLRRCDRDGVPIVNAMALMDLRAALAAYGKEG